MVVGARRTGAGRRAGLWAVRLAALTAVLAVVVGRADAREATARRPGRRRWLSVPASIAMLVALAGTARQDEGVALFQVLAGAAFLGAVLDGLLLGHWYLTDRGLPRRPIDRSTSLLIGAVILEAVAVVTRRVRRRRGGRAVQPPAGSRRTGVAGSPSAWWAPPALIAVMVRLTLRGERASAVQSATGFFYLAVVTAFTAEVAVKVRFLPG